MDALPGYTYFNPTRKVLCAMQIIEDDEEGNASEVSSVFPHHPYGDDDSTKNDPNSIGAGNDSMKDTSVSGRSQSISYPSLED